ncbi:MAG: hypothetical protein HQL13_01280 [Candidatus Omnitrophica bacterium]|nr:hypothetical protein [Candidatus Omnitrophota bacterium]
MLTLISPSHLKTLISLSGQAIREFLAGADSNSFKGEAREAIFSFRHHPGDFSDEKLVEYGQDVVHAINHPARIEIRGKTKDGASQMVSKGIWGSQRSRAADLITQKCKDLGVGVHLKLAGTSSIEFNIDGVDKALPLYFIQNAFNEVLEEMKYQPGPFIDSQKSRIIIAADGDDTIYKGPNIGSLPGLLDSPVRGPLCAYLRAGGVFMLVSGNDLGRSFKRLVDGLPKEVYGRVLVAANGGADLVYVNAKGDPEPVSNYRKHALDFSKVTQKSDLDIYYIGDDGSKEGNDYPAFKAVGFERSVLVARKFLTEYDPGLKGSYRGGLLEGTKQFLEHFLSSHHI